MKYEVEKSDQDNRQIQSSDWFIWTRDSVVLSPDWFPKSPDHGAVVSKRGARRTTDKLAKVSSVWYVALKINNCYRQCCGSMTFWRGSGSGCGCGSGCGSGSCYFRHWPSRCQQKTNFKNSFSAYHLLRVHLHHFLKIESHKAVGIKVFLTIFALWSLTNRSGSGSRRPKSIRIRRIRIRIRHTGYRRWYNDAATYRCWVRRKRHFTVLSHDL